MERISFASRQVGDVKKLGVQAMVERIASNGERLISPGGLVEACLDQVGALSVSDETLGVLLDFASRDGDIRLDASGVDEEARQRIAGVLQMVASTHEFQRS